MNEKQYSKLDRIIEQNMRIYCDDKGLILKKNIFLCRLESLDFFEDNVYEIFDYLRKKEINVVGNSRTYNSVFYNYEYVSRDSKEILGTRITKEKQYKLLNDYKLNNNIDARNELVMSFGKLVDLIASSYSKYLNIEKQELIDCGFIGVISAIDNYEYKRNELSTYIHAYAHGNILMHIYYYYYGYVSVYKGGYFKKVLDELKKEYYYEKDFNEYEHIDEIIDSFVKIGSNEEKDRRMLNLYYASSLSDTDDILSVDTETVAEKAIENVSKQELHDEVVKSFDCLTEKQKEVIELYYGFDGMNRSMKEVANYLGITTQSVSQSIDAGLRRLKNKQYKKLKRAYYN